VSVGQNGDPILAFIQLHTRKPIEIEQVRSVNANELAGSSMTIPITNQAARPEPIWSAMSTVLSKNAAVLARPPSAEEITRLKTVSRARFGQWQPVPGG
jgi:hypothetical protein